MIILSEQFIIILLGSSTKFFSTHAGMYSSFGALESVRIHQERTARSSTSMHITEGELYVHLKFLINVRRIVEILIQYEISAFTMTICARALPKVILYIMDLSH